MMALRLETGTDAQNLQTQSPAEESSSISSMLSRVGTKEQLTMTPQERFEAAEKEFQAAKAALKGKSPEFGATPELQYPPPPPMPIQPPAWQYVPIATPTPVAPTATF